MEETRLQELRKGRELAVQKEENQYLKNLVAEQERSICSLEKDSVQLNMVRGKTVDMLKHLLICRQKFTIQLVRMNRQAHHVYVLNNCLL